MKPIQRAIGLWVSSLLLSAACQAQPFLATDTTFTYQGLLENEMAAVDGKYTFEFSLYASQTGGTPLAPPIVATVDVSDGIFTAQLDFGTEALIGKERYLEISVAPEGGTAQTLSPRQRLGAAPASVQTGGANILADNSVVLQRGPAAFPTTVVSNEVDPSIANFATDPTFWQSFTAPVDCFFDSAVFLVKRPNSLRPSNFVIVRGEGTDGEVIGVGTPQWELFADPFASLRMTPSSPSGDIKLERGEVYSILVSESQISYAEIPIIGAFVGRSSAGPSLASIFAIDGRLLDSPTVSIDAQGWLTAPQLRLAGAFDGWDFLASQSDGSLSMTRARTSPDSNTLELRAEPLLATLRVTDLGMTAAAFEGEDIAVEDRDAVLGLYSDGAGTYGSAISLGELGADGSLIDKWSMYRRTSGFNRELQFAYGPSQFYSQNTINFALRPDGSAFLRGALTQSSTAAEKHDIETIRGALDVILNLRGVSYRWNRTNRADIGFIAEEMADVLPDVVSFSETGIPEGIDYGRITAILVEAVKEQQNKLDAHSTALAQQQRTLELLALRLETLELESRSSSQRSAGNGHE